MIPYDVVSSQNPLSMTSYLPSPPKVQEVDNVVHTGESILNISRIIWLCIEIE